MNSYLSNIHQKSINFINHLTLVLSITGVYLTINLPTFHIGKNSLFTHTILPIASALIFINFIFILLQKNTWSKLNLIPDNQPQQSVLLFASTTTIFSLIFFPQNLLWYFSGIFLIYNLQFTSTKKLQKTIFISASLLAVIALTQFILQSDLNLNLLGEPTISNSTKGIAKLKHNIIRPYGLSQHPNILAFILYLSLFINPFKNSKLEAPNLIAIISTFSLTGLLATSLRYIQKQKNFFIFFSISILIFTLLKSPTFILERLQQFLSIFFQNTQNKPWEIQPIHNTFIISLLQFGPIHFLSIIIMIYTLYKRQTKLTLGIIIFMMFDHHILTNPQSYLLLISTLTLLNKNRLITTPKS